MTSCENEAARCERRKAVTACSIGVMKGFELVRKYEIIGAEGANALNVSNNKCRATYQKKARQNSGGSQTRRHWMRSSERKPALLAGGRAPNAERVERL